MRVFINYKQNAKPDHDLARELERVLTLSGYVVFRDETKLKAGDVWPERILEALSRCEVMLSLISNASMQSKWVLNEIDEAIRRHKNIIPIFLEDLQPDISFTAYRPRLGDVQHIRFNGEMPQMAELIIKALGSESRFRYHDLVARSLSSSGISDPTEVICAMLMLLRDAHVLTAAIADLHNRRTVPSIIGTRKHRTWPESFALYVLETAAMYKNNAEVNLKHNRHQEARSLALAYERTKCLSEILSSALVQWEAEVERTKKNIERLPRGNTPTSSHEGS